VKAGEPISGKISLIRTMQSGKDIFRCI